MSSFVVSEALIIGLKEGIKAGIVWLVFLSYFVLNNKRYMIKPFYWGISTAFSLSFISLALSGDIVSKEIVGNLIEMSFAVFLLSSGAALLHASGKSLFGKGSKAEDVLSGNKNPIISWLMIFCGTLFFFFPDTLGSLVFLKELSVMKAAGFMTNLSALIGFILAVAIFIYVNKTVKPSWIGGFFNFPQLLLFLSMVKLLGSGTGNFTELSLIPSVQRGIMKFTHDVIHQTFVMFMVPDHMLLKTTVWNFIGIFFGPNIAVFAALFILLLLPLLFVYHSLFEPLPESEAITGAKRRKVIHLMLSDRRRKAIPVFFFIGFILIAWFSQRGESVSRLYDPEPRPVVTDGGMVLIPLHDPTMDLMDGMVHKFSLTHQGETIKMLIIKKSNNTLSVCLDACEICPPEGYGQRGDHVVCIFCGTPIPVDTVGQPGGCNPIPLSHIVDERYVKIEVNEILRKWESVKTGESKKAVP